MTFLYRFNWNNWDSSFHANDCNHTRLVLFGMHNIKCGIWLIYASFALWSGYMYGRHKGISFDDIFNNNAKIKRIIELATHYWFVLSIFILPYYLCTVWLFYCIHFDDIHYINTYNPWILPIIIVYMCYSITVIVSFAYYSAPHSRCSYISVRTTLFLYCFLALLMLYILLKNKNNNLSDFSFIGFHGNNILHCFDFNSHTNGILLSIFVILYAYTTHHIFVFLSAFTSILCGGEYLTKRKKIENVHKKRGKLRKRRKKPQIYDKNEEENEGAAYGVDIDEYISDDMDEYYDEVSIPLNLNEPNKPIQEELSFVDPPQAFRYV